MAVIWWSQLLALTYEEGRDFEYCRSTRCFQMPHKGWTQPTPNVVLFDLAGAQPDFTIAVLRKHQGLLLIGVDLTTGKMLVMSGEESRLLTTEDLVQTTETGKSLFRDADAGAGEVNQRKETKP